MATFIVDYIYTGAIIANSTAKIFVDLSASLPLRSEAVCNLDCQIELSRSLFGLS